MSGKISAEIVCIIASQALGDREPASLCPGCAVQRGSMPRSLWRSPACNLVLYLIRSQGMTLPEASENFRGDRAEAIALMTGCFL